MKQIIKNTLILTLITVVAGVCLGYVYEITKDPIAQARERAKQEAYRTVFQDADSFEEGEVSHVANADAMLQSLGLPGVTINEALEAHDASGNLLGYVMTVTDRDGYGGDITLAMGVRMDGTLNNIAFLELSETAGLGMKADTPEFKGQFSDKKVDQFSITKTGAQNEYEIDALSGATFTTTAVVDAVNGGLLYAQMMRGD